MEKIKNENKKLKKDLDEISQTLRDENYDRLYEGFFLLIIVCFIYINIF